MSNERFWVKKWGIFMRFHPLIASYSDDRAALASEYKAAKESGAVRLGELRLYFRAGLRTYYIAYRDIRRVFRRVQLIGAGGKRNGGDMHLENLVICGDAGELAQLQLPGEAAAKQLMEELEKRVPEAEFGKPAAEQAMNR